VDVTAALGREMNVFTPLTGASRQVGRLVGDFLERGIRASLNPGDLAALKSIAVDLLALSESQQG
jgi:hypothetical protein